MKRNKVFVGKLFEDVIRDCREKNNWTYLDVLEHISDKTITEKEVKKWEYGLSYPDIDMIYKLSELYQIPSEEIVQAKNNSLEFGSSSINIYIIKRICFILNVSFITGYIVNILVWIFLVIYAFVFFVNSLKKVIENPPL